MPNAGVDYNSLIGDFAKAGAPTDGDGGFSTSVAKSSGPDLATLIAIGTNVTGVLKAEQFKQAGLEAIQSSLAKQQADVLSAGAVQANQTAAAAGRIAENKTTADLTAQGENIALRNTEGLQPNDPNSVLMKSIKAVSDATDSATANMQKAKAAYDTTLSSVFRGEHSFGDWIDSTFVNTPHKYETDANADKEVANIEAERIARLQQIYTNQAPINATAQSALKASSAADAHAVAAQQYALQATELQKQAIVAGAAQIKELLNSSSTRINQEISLGTLQDKLENSKRTWEALSNKENNNIESYTALVNMGRRVYNLPELTPSQVKTLRDSPSNKAMLDTFGFTGSVLAGAAADPSGGVPFGATGSPGETAVMLDTNRSARLPQGMETLQEKLQSITSSIPPNLNGKPVTAAQKAEYVNNEMANYVRSITDVDSDPIFGKPNIQDVIQLPALKAPALVPFTEKVLKPLATSGQYVPMKMIVEAAVKSGLDDATINAGLGAYAKSAKAYIDVTRRPGLAGVVAPKGYKAAVSTGSMLFSSTAVDFADDKARTDYLFRRGLNERTGGMARADALDTTVLGRKVEK